MKPSPPLKMHSLTIPPTLPQLLGSVKSSLTFTHRKSPLNLLLSRHHLLLLASLPLPQQHHRHLHLASRYRLVWRLEIVRISCSLV
jgi:hypothetical protein